MPTVSKKRRKQIKKSKYRQKQKQKQELKRFNKKTGKVFNKKTGKVFNEKTGKVFNGKTGKVFNKINKIYSYQKKWKEDGDKPRWSWYIYETTEDPTYYDEKEHKKSYRTLMDIDVDVSILKRIKNKNEAVKYIKEFLTKVNGEIICYNIEKNFTELISKWNNRMNTFINYELSSELYSFRRCSKIRDLDMPIRLELIPLKQISIERLETKELQKFICETFHTLSGTYESYFQFNKKLHRYNCKICKLSGMNCDILTTIIDEENKDIIRYKLVWIQDNCDIDFDLEPLAYIHFISEIKRFDSKNPSDDLIKDINSHIETYKYFCPDLTIKLLK
jgi:hypothetical protein